MKGARPGQYVRDHYGVPAFIGARVAYVWPQRHGGPGPRLGKITGFDQQYLIIKFDDEKPGRHGRRDRYHPTWEIEYLDAER